MVHLMRRLLLVLVLLPCVSPAAASAGSDDLWATVNICDTPGARNIIGIRASMPGDGSTQRMYMRFEAQWYSAKRHRFLPTGSSSRWISAGSARFKSSQAGFSFQFDDPPAGTSFLMRGKVSYQWRARRGKRWVAVRRASRFTRAGISGVKGGDPTGRSDARCRMRH
jgi:hypothetical protein